MSKLTINVRFEGRWGNAMSKLKGFGKIAEKKKKELEEYLASEALAIVKRHIDKQDLPWPSLSTAYLSSKLQEGLSTDTWAATREFRDKLRVRRFKGMLQVGASGMVNHKASGLSMLDIATILEYGAPEVGLQARPLFRPSMKEFKAWLKKKNGLWASAIKAEFFAS